jgi:hypothetical protein
MKAGTDRPGCAKLGGTRLDEARQARLDCSCSHELQPGKSRRESVGLGRHEPARLIMAGNVKIGSGVADVAWSAGHGRIANGANGPGLFKARQTRLGRTCHCWSRHDRASGWPDVSRFGGARPGASCCGKADAERTRVTCPDRNRHGFNVLRSGKAGEARTAGNGSASQGWGCFGEAGEMWPELIETCHGGSRRGEPRTRRDRQGGKCKGRVGIGLVRRDAADPARLDTTRHGGTSNGWDGQGFVRQGRQGQSGRGSGMDGCGEEWRGRRGTNGQGPSERGAWGQDWGGCGEAEAAWPDVSRFEKVGSGSTGHGLAGEQLDRHGELNGG